MKNIMFYVIAGIVVLFALQSNAPSRKFDDVPERLLDRAIVFNDAERVKSIIEGKMVGVNDIIAERYHERPIHVAAYYGRDEIIKYLVQQGADLNFTIGGGKTALSMAIWKRHESTAILLLDLGADPKIPNDVGVTPCVVAKRVGMQRVVNKIPDCI